MRLPLVVALLVACDSKPTPTPTPEIGPAAAALAEEFKDAQKKSAENQVMQVHQAAELHMLRERGECPKSVAQLVASKELAKEVEDPWGGAFEIRCDAEGHLAVASAGPDRKPKTDDDIVYTQDR